MAGPKQSAVFFANATAAAPVRSVLEELDVFPVSIGVGDDLCTEAGRAPLIQML